MASERSQGTESPSASSIFLPLGRRSRRPSVSTQAERENLNEILDQIHTTASQSDDLTVFNEFTKPPASSIMPDNKGIVRDLQGGLSGLYSRLRASVGGVKDIVAQPSKPARSHEDTQSLKSDNLPSPSVTTSPDARPDSVHYRETLPTTRPKSPEVSFRKDPFDFTTNSRGYPRSESAETSSNTSLQKPDVPSLDQHTATWNPIFSELGNKNRISQSVVKNGSFDKNASGDNSSQSQAEFISPSQKNSHSKPHISAEELSLKDGDASYLLSLPAYRASGSAEPCGSTRASRHEIIEGSPQNGDLDMSFDNDHRPSHLLPQNPPGLQSEAAHCRSASSPSADPERDVSPAHISSRQAARGLSPDLRSPRSPRARPDPPPMTNTLLSKEFWMRDETARDCFLCGEPFSTFRRKHHCRTCGQIFDAKCTSIVSGTTFGHSGSIRVCKQCEAKINAYDDSSDYSGDDMSQSLDVPGPDNLSTRNLSPPPAFPRGDDDTASVVSTPAEHLVTTPTMAIPTRRTTINGNRRRSAIIEFDSDRQLSRPTSSRSMKPSLSGRPFSMHKRHYSRPQYRRSFKPHEIKALEERAPFQRRLGEETASYRLPTFHRDSIIDPDLAQYLSDDDSSADDQPNMLSMESDNGLPKNSSEPEKTSFGGLLAAVRRSRSLLGDKNGTSALSRNVDDGSIVSSRPNQSQRRRNMSFASNGPQRFSSRFGRDGSSSYHGHDPSWSVMATPPSKTGGKFKMTRSSSMKGEGAPSVELNRVSLEHVRKLLRQLLVDEGVPHPRHWETALIPILLRATDDVDPAVQDGDDMDIRHYVKLKKVPGGRPGDTSYVSGLVFTKNVALKSMSRSISRPRILIVTFPLEYARQQQQFMSLKPVIDQENEFLQNLVNRISALNPNLVLVEKNVSGRALEMLTEARIVTAYNVKPSVLEAVSRCTNARIVTSMDRLVANTDHIGHAGSFDVKTYVHRGRKKTYMYISDCPKELGCTVVLRGADDKLLMKIKGIAEFMMYVVYNLKLETYLLRDEYAKAPQSFDSTKMSQPLDVKISGGNSRQPAIATENGGSNNESKPQVSDHQALVLDAKEDMLHGGIPNSEFYDDMVEKQNTKILSASPFVKFSPPYLLMRARELERHLEYLKRLKDQDVSDQHPDEDKSKSQKFVLITPEMVHESLAGASGKVREVLHAVHDAEYDRALHHYLTQKRQWETYVLNSVNMFDPFAHQNIVLLYSVVCSKTSTPCSGPDLFAFSFYNEHDNDFMFEPDCTLGQYVEDLCQSANVVCTGNGCEERMVNHHRQYVHGEGHVSVLVKPHPSKLPGYQNTILMWNCCRLCSNETPPITMSPSTWKYSFAKYLELTFWGQNMNARAGVCRHDLHRDYVRYFGYKDMALWFQYDPITLLEIVVPRPRVTWKVENDLQLRNEIYGIAVQRLSRFMGSLKTRLKNINVGSVVPEMAESCKQEIEKLLKQVNEEHASLLKQHQEMYMASRYWEVIPLNRMIRATQEKLLEWENTFAEFEKNYFPSEKDITRMASQQLRRFLGDNTGAHAEEGPEGEGAEAEAEGEGAEGEEDEENKPEGQEISDDVPMTPQEAEDVLVSVVKENSGQKPGVPSPTLSPVEENPPYMRTLQEKPDLPEKAITSTEGLSETLSPGHNKPQRIPSSNVPSSSPSDQKEKQTDEGTVPAWHGNSDTTTEPKQAMPSTKKDSQESPLPISPRQQQPSAIPRPQHDSHIHSPRSLLRSSTQPLGFGDRSPSIGQHSIFRSNTSLSTKKDDSSSNFTFKPGERKLSERFGLSPLRTGKIASAGHSLIPRSIHGKKSSRVVNLAAHFEQLSREFEKERQKEREQRANQKKLSRAAPIPLSNPVVEVYKDVRDAVERDPAEDEMSLSAPKTPCAIPEEIQNPVDSTKENDEKEQKSNKEIEGNTVEAPPAKLEDKNDYAEEKISDNEGDNLVGHDMDEEADKTNDGAPMDLTRDGRSFLLKLLTNFWAERSASGWTPLQSPLDPTEHIFADTDIIVREDEPSSLIAFALGSEPYKKTLMSCLQIPNEALDTPYDVEQVLLRDIGTHFKYQFDEGNAKMMCKVFYTEQFDALRRKCGVSTRILDSLSRCMKWDSRGGKTKSVFLKTLDQRFILKSLSAIETDAFIRFAPAYFQIMSEALFHELPSAIAKMFGFYQVVLKNPVSGNEFSLSLLLMENLFYDRTPVRIFDLKGSMRNRKVQSTGERNEVLLDENMVEFIYESPLFTREHSKKLLSQSVWNDTLFLARQNVMDYSLMVAIDEPRCELVVGIIDCIRTYTWDKKLESWIKDRNFPGTGKNRPTVTSPKEYKSRFREAMARYVLHAPK